MTTTETLEAFSLSFAGRLNKALKRIGNAQGSNAVCLAAAKAAQELSRADGFCVVANDASQYWVVTLEDVQRLPFDRASTLGSLIGSSSAAGEAIVQHRPGLEVELPTGRRLHTETLLTVPFGATATHLSLSYFWCDGFLPSTEQLALLPALAWTSSLALRTQQREEELQHSQEQQRSQIVGLQHRARNILALVRSIIRRSSIAADSTEYFAQHLEARISALARTLGALSIDGRAGPELEDLIRAEMAANAVRENQFELTGPSVRLSIRGAETMALTLHELTTNALKFGALTTPEGHIAVSWSVDASTQPARLRWHWAESGVSLVAMAMPRRGFGQELIERVLPYELDARTQFTFAPGGLFCEIDLPINERTVSLSDAP